MKTFSLAIAMFTIFLFAGIGVAMMTPEPAIAGAGPGGIGCKCPPQIHCQPNQGECPSGNIPHYSCRQSALLFGCPGPFDCGCSFVFCGAQCNDQ